MNIKWLIGAISVGLFISCENVKEAQTVSNSYPSGIRLLLKGYDINLSRFGLHRMLLTNGLLIG